MPLKILIVDDEEGLREIISCILELELGDFSPLFAEDGAAAFQKLSKNLDTDLIISDYKMPVMDGEIFFKKVQSDTNLSQIPFVFCSAEGKNLDKLYKEYNLFYRIEKPDVVEGIKKVVTKLKELKSLSWIAPKYYPIDIHLLQAIKYMGCVLLLKLSTDKFVKVFEKEAIFSNDDFIKYKDKKVSHLYVEDSDKEKSIQTLDKYIRSLNFDKKEIKEFASVNQIVVDLLKIFSFSQIAQENTKKWVAKSVSELEKNKNLKKYLDSILSDSASNQAKNCALVNLFSLELAMAMDWRTAETYNKLTYASLLHDIGISDLSLDDFETLPKDLLSAESHLELKQHPIRGSELCRKFKDMPADVDRIILEHHEKPDGSGVPRGLIHSQIFPLSSIFIIAHFAADLVLRADKVGKRLDKNELILELEKEFTQYNFKKIVDAYKKDS